MCKYIEFLVCNRDFEFVIGYNNIDIYICDMNG